MDSGIAILIAAALATGGWLHTNRTTQRTSRRQHTFKFYFDFTMNDINASNVRHVMWLIESDKIPPPYDTTRADDYRVVDRVLDQYEYIASAIYNGDMDEGFVCSVDGSMFKKLSKDLKNYIDNTRERQSTAFKNLTNLTARWEIDNLTWFHVLYEWWRMRLYVELPPHVRWLNKKILCKRLGH